MVDRDRAAVGGEILRLEGRDGVVLQATLPSALTEKARGDENRAYRHAAEVEDTVDVEERGEVLERESVRDVDRAQDEVKRHGCKVESTVSEPSRGRSARRTKSRMRREEGGERRKDGERDAQYFFAQSFSVVSTTSDAPIL